MNVVRKLHATITTANGHSLTLEGSPTYAKLVLKNAGNTPVEFTLGASELSVLRDLFQAGVNELISATSPIVSETTGKDPREHGGQDDCG